MTPPSYSAITFTNLPISAIRAMGYSYNPLLSLLNNELHFDKAILKRIIIKAVGFRIRSSYLALYQRYKT